MMERDGSTRSATRHQQQRAILGFRSPLLRELSVRSQEQPEVEHDDDTAVSQQQQQPASPRLLGYLFAVVAGSVQLVSVIQ